MTIPVPEGPVTKTKSEKEREAKWQLEDDVRTVKNFNDLRRDRPRMSAAVRDIKRQAKDLTKIASGFGGKTRKTGRKGRKTSRG